jgi:hypothetical protein
VGFASNGCDKAYSVMEEIQPNQMQGATTSVGCADRNAVSNHYYEEPDYCANGGCTPGYVPYPSGACSEAPLDMCGCCQNYSPIVIDLSGDNILMSDASDGAPFDTNGFGKIVRVAFPLVPDDVWLALDRNGNGKLDDGSELFGNTTPLAAGGHAEHGFVALAELDSNRDGLVSAADEAFSRLLLWFDANRDGESVPSELTVLSGSRVVAISTDVRMSQKKDKFGNRFKYRAKVYYADGRQSFAYDVFPVVRAIESLSSIAPPLCAKPNAIGIQAPGLQIR